MILLEVSPCTRCPNLAHNSFFPFPLTAHTSLAAVALFTYAKRQIVHVTSKNKKQNHRVSLCHNMVTYHTIPTSLLTTIHTTMKRITFIILVPLPTLLLLAPTFIHGLDSTEEAICESVEVLAEAGEMVRTQNCHDPPSWSDIEDENKVVEQYGNDSTVREFFGTFHRLGVSWGHILRSYRRIIGLAGGGADLPDDVVAQTMPEALTILQNMAKDLEMPDFVYDAFGKTRQDLLSAFLYWASTEEGQKKKSLCKGGINERSNDIKVSKAFRRLEAYVDWMKQSEQDFEDAHTGNRLPVLPPPKVYDAFRVSLTRDACGRIVWWMDLDLTDEDAVRTFDASESRRFFVWFAHFVMFNKDAQQNGIVFMNNLAHLSFWNFMTMLPLEVGIKTDEFMICVVCLKTKLVTFANRPAWATFAYRILSVFLKKDMKRRVFNVKDNTQEESIKEVLGGGEEYIPAGYFGFKGTSGIDLLANYYNAQIGRETEKQSSSGN